MKKSPELKAESFQWFFALLAIQERVFFGITEASLAHPTHLLDFVEYGLKLSPDFEQRAVGDFILVFGRNVNSLPDGDISNWISIFANQHPEMLQESRSKGVRAHLYQLTDASRQLANQLINQLPEDCLDVISSKMERADYVPAWVRRRLLKKK